MKHVIAHFTVDGVVEHDIEEKCPLCPKDEEDEVDVAARRSAQEELRAWLKAHPRKK